MRKRRGLGDHPITRDGHEGALRLYMEEVPKAVERNQFEAARNLLRHADYELDQVEWHQKTGIRGLGDGCRDARGFVPVPACRGHHVPRPAGGRRKGCQYGVNKRTGKCLKHPRKRR